jgi:hypothetical protein
MLYAFGRKSPFFHDTVRVQDAIFKSGQERLAEVGHGVRVLGVGFRHSRGSGVALRNLPFRMVQRP